MAQIWRQCVSEHHAKIRSELSAHTAENGFRKDAGCAKNKISVRFRRKVTLLVNKLFLHSQLLTVWGDNSFLIFAWCATHLNVIFAPCYPWCTNLCVSDTVSLNLAWTGLQERFGWWNCCSLCWNMVMRVEIVQVACGSAKHKVSSKNLPAILL